MLLILDNYDSFVYNLVQYFGMLGACVEVRRNDQTTVAEIEQFAPSGIVLSPGPCSPNEAGISVDVIRHFANKVPIFGVCLGHQSIGVAFGATICRAQRPMHGKISVIQHTNHSLFAGLNTHFEVVRYHSLIIEEATLPECLSVTARSSEGEIMAVCHKQFPLYGVQFHPESVFTCQGLRLLENFLRISGIQVSPTSLGALAI